MPLLSHSSRTKGPGQTVAATGGSHCSPLQARSLPESSSTDSLATSQRGTYLKLSVASDLAAEPQTWCLPCNKYSQEKCIEQQMDLYAVFIDLTKAFHTVNEKTLWVILKKSWMPTQVQYTGQAVPWQHERTSTLQRGLHILLDISNGVKQGCVLAPVLFNLVFTQYSTMLWRTKLTAFYSTSVANFKRNSSLKLSS